MKGFSTLFLLTLLSTVAIGQSGPPPLCKPCLFYGGDLDGGANEAMFWNENTLNDANTQTFGEITVPKGHAVLVEGILFQALFQSEFRLDPKVVPWQIRSGNIFADGGNLVASGSSGVLMQPTGRQVDGAVEYTVVAKVDPPLELNGGAPRGTEYWFNLMPQCTNSRDQVCHNIIYYVSNTTYETNSVRGAAQKGGLAVINSPLRGYQWETLCEIEFRGCDWLSFGLIGTALY